MTNTIPGIKVTHPYADPADARYQCEECGAWSATNQGKGVEISHGKRCESRPQVASVAAKSPTNDRLAKFAADVRRTGLTKGRDQDVADAVRLGYLSTSDAMNTDD